MASKENNHIPFEINEIGRRQFDSLSLLIVEQRAAMARGLLAHVGEISSSAADDKLAEEQEEGEEKDILKEMEGLLKDCNEILVSDTEPLEDGGEEDVESLEESGNSNGTFGRLAECTEELEDLFGKLRHGKEEESERTRKMERMIGEYRKKQHEQARMEAKKRERVARAQQEGNGWPDAAELGIPVEQQLAVTRQLILKFDAQGKSEVAEELCRHACELVASREEAGERDLLEMARFRTLLGNACRKQGKHRCQEAEKELRKAMAIWAKCPQHKDIRAKRMWTMTELSHALYGQGQIEKAEKYCTEALKMREQDYRVAKLNAEEEEEAIKAKEKALKKHRDNLVLFRKKRREQEQQRAQHSGEANDGSS